MSDERFWELKERCKNLANKLGIKINPEELTKQSIPFAH